MQGLSVLHYHQWWNPLSASQGVKQLLCPILARALSQTIPGTEVGSAPPGENAKAVLDGRRGRGRGAQGKAGEERKSMIRQRKKLSCDVRPQVASACRYGWPFSSIPNCGVGTGRLYLRINQSRGVTRHRRKEVTRAETFPFYRAVSNRQLSAAAILEGGRDECVRWS